MNKQSELNTFSSNQRGDVHWFALVGLLILALLFVYGLVAKTEHIANTNAETDRQANDNINYEVDRRR